MQTSTSGAPIFPAQCVIDSSVLIKLVLVELDSDLVRALLTETSLDARAIPDLAFVECANVLASRVRRQLLPSTDAHAAYRDLHDVGLTSHPTTPLVGAALTLAISLAISVYDAIFVALADQLHVPLITADDALARQIAGPPEQVRTLASFRQP